ncbi:SCP2 sterol-binding domain-containing protein [Pikeienuella sp. HZG-20]|uniref:SCP2 sterol-binding domain-containing protein n=1 Tax=Paludibacillus litoralis TaxID=3133267 RepID=UPI0030EB7D2B
MSTHDDIPQEMRDRVAASDFDKVLKFDCGDDGVLIINRREVTREDMEADCVISLSKKDLKKLLTGDLSPTTAFMTGKIKVDGDLSVALQLQTLL